MTTTPYPAEPALFVAGAWVGPAGRETIPVRNPATGAELARLPVAGAEDVDAALAGAHGAAAPWRASGPDARGAVLRGAAALLRERADALATQATLEQGKTLAETRIEVQLAAATLEWSAEEGRRAYGRVLAPRPSGTRMLVAREPVGPVAAFTPWNFPFAGPARKIGAALAAGCPCVLKAAEETPASALAIARALQDAGLPDGVLSVVCGRPAEIAQRLIASPVVRAVSLTGSVTVGRELSRLAAEAGPKRTTMELGGHAPVVVLDDADLDPALNQLAFAAFRNAGQICVSPTRFYVQEGVYEAFVEGLAARARAIAVGDGLDPETQMGPLAHARRVAAVAALVDDAVAAGAQVVAGGGALDGPGCFFAPTVLADVPEAARAMREEPFGPVALVAPVADLDEAVARANALPYGLAAYGFTRGAAAQRALGERLEAGIVGLNTVAIAAPDAPFGGVKDSGHGSEEGAEGVGEHLVTKLLCEA